MITNLNEYFKPEQEIFLDTVSYNRVENIEAARTNDISLICQDNVKATLEGERVKLIITRSVIFDPDIIFNLTVSFGAVLRFNDRRNEVDWSKTNLAEEFRENGDFITGQLMSRITLLIGQITSSFGVQPLILPTALAKKERK